MSIDRAKELALAEFAKGFNCAESVLLGIVEALEMDVPVVPRIATGFGAGAAANGEICGALTGAIMALGLLYGRDEPDQEKKNALYEKVNIIVDSFKEEFGAVRCIELTEVDMRTPKGMQLAAERKLHIDFCPKFVAFAAELAAKKINS